MRPALIILILLNSLSTLAQLDISSTIISVETKQALAGVTIEILSKKVKTYTDNRGRFELRANPGDTVRFSFIGFKSQRHAAVDLKEDMVHSLEKDTRSLEAVEISTGYYTATKERSSGSFTNIDRTLLDRNPSPNILQRLEGLGAGLQFVTPEGRSPGDIRVRGLSTIESDASPLIVLDNFPYEGDINSINPEDIESVTILNDASAASIWGAKAGNGVIVLTSKQAKKDGTTTFSFNAHTSLRDKPDLFYNRNWLPADVVMQIEKERYEKGGYTFADNISIPLYVELLRAAEENSLDQESFTKRETEFRAADVRNEAMRHLYRKELTDNYSFTVSGGAQTHNYVLSGAFNRQDESVNGDSNQGVNINARNSFSVHKKVDVQLGINFSSQSTAGNGVDFNRLNNPRFGISPYYRLTDDEGSALPIVKDYRYAYASGASEDGLLDWLYRPVSERDLTKNKGFSSEIRFNTGVNYRPISGLRVDLSYQYIAGNTGSTVHYMKDSYYVRSLVNRFTQPNGQRIIPNNGIFESSPSNRAYSHFARGQAAYDKTIADNQHISLLAGAEIRHGRRETMPGSILYNFDDEYQTGTNQMDFVQNYSTRPQATARVPNAGLAHSLLTNRDLSYYGNLRYILHNRYIVNGSLRWDGSNLFGVKTNQKGTPLWSVGGSWNLSDERFYPFKNAVPYLRFRSTYGVAGNVNRSITHYPVATFSTGPLGYGVGRIQSVGNPSLRWEKVKTLNAALDFKFAGNKLSGSIERYVKKGDDLIGDDFMDPTSGVMEYKINYADIQSRGWDLTLNLQHGIRIFNWSSSLIMSYVENEVTHYNTNPNVGTTQYLLGSGPPAVGLSRDVMYSIPWNGLSNETGQPLIYQKGVEVTGYAGYLNQLTVDDLIKSDVNVPRVYGSFRNVMGYRDFTLEFFILYKGLYAYRHSSMAPGDEFSNNYHMDYYSRWEKPGDEKYTDVPSYVALEALDTEMRTAGTVYKLSDALIKRADHLRLQDVQVSYRLNMGKEGRKPVHGRITAYARNLGTLWSYHKNGIDPDFVDAISPRPRIYGLMLRVNY